MTMGKEGAERCYAVMFKHSKAHETQLHQFGTSTGRGGLIVLHDQLHHAATNRGRWQFVRIMRPPAAAMRLSTRGLHRHSTGIALTALSGRLKED